MKNKLSIISILFFIAFSANGIGFIEIYNIGMEDCHRATAESFLSAFEKHETLIMLLHLSDEIEFSRIVGYSKEIKGEVSGRLSYREIKDSLSYSRIYRSTINGKRKSLFKITVRMKEGNPFLIEKVELSRNVRMPKKLKKLIKRLGSKNTNEEQKREIAELLKPAHFPDCRHVFNVNWEKGDFFISNDDWTPGEIDFFNPVYLNETNIPLNFTVGGRDSLSIPAKLGEFNNLEKVKLNGYFIKSFPENLEALGNIKHLEIYVYKKSNDAIKIPKSIGNLKSLESLKIVCDNCVELPSEMINLNNLRQFEFKGEHLDLKSIKLVNRIKEKIKESGG